MAMHDVLNTGSHLQRNITSFDINDIKSLCIKHIPEWNKYSFQDLQVNRFSSGIMNYVFKITSFKDSKLNDVVFRVFDFDPNSSIDRIKEDTVFEMAGCLGVGPKVLAKFRDLAANGCRIEEYIPSEPFIHDSFFKEDLVRKFGKCIGKFHTKMANKFPDWDKTNELEKSLNDWYNEAITFKEHSNIFDSAKIKNEISWYLTELKKRAVTNNHAYKTVLSHNDILQFNILARTDIDDVSIIDLELAGFNFAAYDLGSFVAVSHFLFGIKEFPFINVLHDMVYPEQLIKILATNYLEASGVKFDDDYIKSFIGEIRFLELGYWLNRILFIGLRSLKQEEEYKREIMAEFSRNISKTYFYKKDFGIANKYFNL